MKSKMKWISIAVIVLFISAAFSVAINGNDYEEQADTLEGLEGNVIATITYRSNECSMTTLQPIVVIKQPADGAVVTDPHLVVLGYAADETGLNYWEWTWEWESGSHSNSSYFETAEYVEFRIDIYGLHPGWNRVTVCFKNVYGSMGCDSVTVTYAPPDNEPPQVTIEEPAEGQVFTEPDITVTGHMTDNVGIVSIGSHHEWEDGEEWTSGTVDPPQTYYPFQWDFTLYEGWNTITIYTYDGAENYGEDSVTVTHTTDTEPPEVTIEYPPDGSTFTEPDITVSGHMTDNVGIVSIGSHHEWEDGEEWTSGTVDPPVTYYPFEWDFELREGWNRITITGVDDAGNEGEETVIYTYSPFVKVDLTIYDGLEGTGGGQEVSEDKEETRGAFTITNIQDTNGNGTRDCDENPVKATAKGRDEVDLMKMVLHKPEGTGVKPNDDVTLTLSGGNKDAVRLWNDSIKTKEILPRGGPWVYKVKDLEKEVWVEIAEENPAKLVMRGITFKLEWFENWDTVKATGIWSEVTDVKHDAKDAGFPDPWGDMPAALRNFLTGGTYRIGGFGLQRFQSRETGNLIWYYGNVIITQFTVYPPGIENENDVRFDIARQMHFRDRFVPPRANLRNLPAQENWPNQVELPNDDQNDLDDVDESVGPSANRHMYSADAPRFPEDAGFWGNNILFIDSSNNFMEFMRVRLDGVNPSGNRVEGSRCSDYHLWHAALWLSRDPRNPGNVVRRFVGRGGAEIHPINCVEDGHILMLDFRPPWK